MLNERLRELRKANGTSLRYIAYKSGITQSTLAAVESGARTPSVSVLWWYCKLFKANADEVLSNKVDHRVTYYLTGDKSYKKVTVNGKQKWEHRAVMERLIGRPLLPGEVVHHKDGNKLNNNPANLVLLKKSDHSKMHCQGLKARRRPVAQMDKSGNVLRVWECAYNLSSLHFDASNIAKVCNGKQKTAYGYVWKYL